MAYKRISPMPIVEGGTGDQSFTAYAPVCGGTTTTGALQVASTGQSTSGFVLTSTGSSSLPTFQAAGGASQTVGTWTPVLNFGGATTGITYGAQLGNYVQTGKNIYFTCYIALSNKGSATGVATITGWPFNFATTNATIYYFAVPFNFASVPVVGDFTSVMVVTGATTAGLYGNPSITQWSDTNFANNTQFAINGVYQST